MRVIIQHDEKDCGAACLTMIARYYGYKMSIQTARELTFSGRNGTSIYNIIKASKQIGLESKGQSGTMEELLDEISNNTICFPLIAHLKSKHFIVIEKVSKNFLVILDPNIGKLKISRLNFEEMWSGYIITFQKKPEFKKNNLTKNRYKKYIILAASQWKKLLIILVMSVTISLIGLIGTYLFQTVIDEYVHSIVEENSIQHEEIEDKNLLELVVSVINKDEDINYIFIVVIILYLFQCSIRFLRSCIVAWLSKKIDTDLIIGYYRQLQRLPISVLNARMTGDYMSRLSDAVAIREAISSVTVTFVFDGFMMLFGGWLLFEQSNYLFRYALLMVFLYVITIAFYRKSLYKISNAVMERNAEVQAFFKESIDGIETVKNNNATNKVVKKFIDKFSKLIRSLLKGNIIYASEDTVISLIDSVGTTLLIWYGFYTVKNGILSLGSLITFYFLLSYFIMPAKNLIELQPAIQKALVAIDRLNDILDMKVENDSERKMSVLNQIDTIEYRNTNFSFDGENDILNGFTLKANKGQKIALVGKSGCGKSTAMKLLIRLYESNGSILINGKAIDIISLSDLRNKITYINQETFLFSDTIYNNIILGCDTITEKEVYKICELCGINNFLKRFPYGLKTILEENGMDLSSGQRQRVAIARALVKKPEIIIFDEATCNLDKESEEEINQLIYQLKDILCIIISHNEKIIKNCDMIFVMEDGKIVEEGRYSSLKAVGKKYKELFDDN